MLTPSSAESSGVPSGDPEYPHRYTAAFANLIEPRWQQRWERENTFGIANPGDGGFDARKPKFFCMDMFPYPSGAGLHVGHPEGYTATDIICRYRRHTGCNVLHPMGWDAFGLPAEQYAIATGVHPSITTRKAIDTFRRQLKRFGFSYDWGREFATIDPDYYQWTQWIFLRIYNSFYDTAQNQARPIAELIAEFERTARPVLINPHAAEFSSEQKAQTYSAWKALDKQDQRTIIDSYRLAYIAEQMVNWCPKLGTALANEEVIDGRSERGDYPVFRKPLRQWMFRITAYADRLLNDLALVKWPESTRTQQSEWIGRSEGAEIEFALDPQSTIQGPRSLRVFTTRPDTIFGATFMVVAPEHPLIAAILKEGGTGVSPAPTPAENGRDARSTGLKALRAYVEAARNRTDVDRQADAGGGDKTGVFTGVYAINPATNQRIPIWTADYVLMGYGHGAIMAVPGHDERDHAFARTFALPIVEVVRPKDPSPSSPSIADSAFVGEGAGVNSANADVSLNGLATADAKKTIIDWLERTGLGVRRINYRLRDWLFSRQRYWGEPFPIVFDAQGRHYPIDDKHLPLTLPDMADYQPIESDDPQPLLAKATDWINTTAGAAGVDPKLLAPDTPVQREANTMPGWAGSCWYYLRYCDPKNVQRFVSHAAERYWMVSQKSGGAPHAGGVDLYIGGNEHAVLHLLYARFWHKVLFDLGEVSTPEPFGRLFHQGMILSWAYRDSTGRTVPIDEVEERDGKFILKATGEETQQIVAKMSKTLKNVHNPDEVIAEYGADTFRLYEMYMGPLDASKPWNPRDIAGCFRFLARAWRLVIDEQTGALRLAASRNDQIEKQLHRMLVKVAGDIERLAFNTAISTMIEFTNAAISAATPAGSLTREQVERFAITLSPFAPHLAEELWARLGHTDTIAYAPWPSVDEAMLRDESIEMPVQISGKVRGKITVPTSADAKAIEELALQDEKVAQMFEGKTVRKVIVVPGKIINIVAN
jgi:leucyl-tRNA synthetase